MMQIEPLNAGDGVVLAPAIGSAVGAAHEQPVQHREEYRALQRKTVLAFALQLADHRANTSPGPLRRTPILIAAPSLAALSTMALAEKRAPERPSRSSWPLACNS